MSGAPEHPLEVVLSVLAARAHGTSYRTIARETGLPLGAVAGILHRKGATMPNGNKSHGAAIAAGHARRLAGRRDYNPAVVAAARMMWLRGASVSQIGRALDLQFRWVDQMRQRENWEPHPRPPPKPAPVVEEAPRAAVRPRRLAELVPSYASAATHSFAEGRLCAFPTNDGRAVRPRRWLFCGAPVTIPGSYCADHRAVCYVARPMPVPRANIGW